MIDEFLAGSPIPIGAGAPRGERMPQPGSTPPLPQRSARDAMSRSTFRPTGTGSPLPAHLRRDNRLDLAAPLALPSASSVAPRQVRFAPEELGRGAFGSRLSRPRHRARSHRCPESPTGRPPGTPEEVDRFLREARSAAQLDHPHIVPVHDSGRAGETCYLACAFVPGTTLAQSHGGRPAPASARPPCSSARVAEALHYAHRQGVVHRDVKPANILLDRQAEPHLTDFGLAKREAGEITLTLDGEALGHPGVHVARAGAG